MAVYFIQAGGGGPVKIGTAKSATARLAGLQTSMPHTLNLLRTIEGGRQNFRRVDGAAAMGIDWPTTRAEIANAVPPAYAEFIGRAALAQIPIRPGGACPIPGRADQHRAKTPETFAPPGFLSDASRVCSSSGYRLNASGSLNLHDADDHGEEQCDVRPRKQSETVARGEISP